MKLMIASDIHGSAYYCKKMLEAYKKEEADRLLLLGDILYHGPRNDLPKDYNPKECIAMLNPMKEHLLCVRGNCVQRLTRWFWNSQSLPTIVSWNWMDIRFSPPMVIITIRRIHRC